MNCAVIFTYSFDSEVAVYLFEREEDAVKFLFDSYSEELRIDLYENGWNSVGEISPDGLYAKITTSFPDGEDVTEMYVGTIYSRE